MAEAREHVLYVDGLGEAHSALITAVNQRGDYCPVCQSNSREVRQMVGGAPCPHDKYHKGEAPTEHYVTLVYVEKHRVESDNVVKMPDVKHISMLEREANPDLPNFHVNCWKYEDEYHTALPEDHPTFEHPFKVPDYDQDGNPIPTGRPKFAAAIADHRETSLSMAAGAVVPAPVDLSLDATPDQEAAKLGAAVQTEAERLRQATVDAAEQAAAEAEAANMPSANDLDAVSDEQKAKDDTSGDQGEVPQE